MDYEKHYAGLITQAQRTTASGWTELHHILPKSMGGRDDPSNLVALTPREHLLAHMLLYKAGHTNQIFAVAQFFETNPRRPNLKIPRWTRRAWSIHRNRIFTRP